MSPAVRPPDPLVSVIMPVWNAAPTLAEAVSSVRAQTWPDWELVLIDDGSSDASPGIAAGLAAADPRIRLLARGANGGAAAARNDGIRAARGRFLAFLDADDRWRPEKLARQLAFMGQGGHAFAFSSYRRMAADGRPGAVVPVPARVTHAELLRGNVIGCLTAIYDSAVLGKVEMPPLARRQDYALWLSLLRRLPAAHGLNAVLADYRVSPGSLSGNKLVAAAATWRLYREQEGLSPLGAGTCFLHYALRGVRQRLAPPRATPEDG